MYSIELKLNISTDQYQKNYQSIGAIVHTHSVDGRSVQFPANILQRFVTHAGVIGHFKIEFDDSGKFLQILRV